MSLSHLSTTNLLTSFSLLTLTLTLTATASHALALPPRPNLLSLWRSSAPLSLQDPQIPLFEPPPPQSSSANATPPLYTITYPRHPTDSVLKLGPTDAITVTWDTVPGANPPTLHLQCWSDKPYSEPDSRTTTLPDLWQTFPPPSCAHDMQMNKKVVDLKPYYGKYRECRFLVQKGEERERFVEREAVSANFRIDVGELR